MSAKDYGWQVGMDVFAVYTDRYSRKEPQIQRMKVTKVGRKWVTFGEGHKEDRFDPETGWIDGRGYSNPGKVYASESEYTETTERAKLWSDFRSRTTYDAPDHIPLDRLKEIIAELMPGRDEE